MPDRGKPPGSRQAAARQPRLSSQPLAAAFVSHMVAMLVAAAAGTHSSITANATRNAALCTNRVV